MELKRNAFKRAIAAGRRQIGIWHAIRDSAVTEMLGDCGFDWILIDCEHSPNSEADVLSRLQALNGSATAPVVRPTCLNVAEIKRLLDVGAQTILVPYVQSVAEAELAVQAMRYPPQGVRGVSTGSRASRYGAVSDYFARANDEACLLVQVETRVALDRLEKIAAVEGVDGVFIGPADLAASLGHPGDIFHPDVVEAIEDAMRRIRSAGKPAGFLSSDRVLLEKVVAAGCVFTAVDIDFGLLRRAALSRLQGAQGWKG